MGEAAAEGWAVTVTREGPVQADAPRRAPWRHGRPASGLLPRRVEPHGPLVARGHEAAAPHPSHHRPTTGGGVPGFGRADFRQTGQFSGFHARMPWHPSCGEPPGGGEPRIIEGEA
jgi:hypothetical protein